MTSPWTVQRTARLVFVVLILACVIPLMIQRLGSEQGPLIKIVDTSGRVRELSLADMKRLPILTRLGSYQNQYGNWRDEGMYAGVYLKDILGVDAYASVDVVAEDGYRVTVERSRVEDLDYPMILALQMNDVSVPEWEDGFRIAVLPESGRVSNADYGVESVGGYWVKRVVQLTLNP